MIQQFISLTKLKLIQFYVSFTLLQDEKNIQQQKSNNEKKKWIHDPSSKLNF